MSQLASILIPAFNAAASLEATLASATRQTWPHREIIVVDDGSTDDTAAVAQRFAGAGVRLIRQANAGPSAARNTAFAASRGALIQFLDADDLLHPEKVAIQARRLASGPPGRVAAGPWGRFRDDPAGAYFKREVFWRDSEPAAFLSEMWTAFSMMQPGAYLTPRPLLEAAGPWDAGLTLNEDGELFARVVMASQGVLFCDDALTYYRSGNAASLSYCRTPAARASHFRSIELMSGHLLASEMSARTRRACARLWQELAYTHYPADAARADEAERRARALGGCAELPSGGRAFRALAATLGWRRAMNWRARLGRGGGLPAGRAG